jgi:GMP synthase (glutamine-hydrolysing)
MKTLILQHEKSTPAGTTLQWLEQKKWPFEIVIPSEVAKLPSSDSFDLLVVCGGSMNVDQEAQFPWLLQEKKLIQEAIVQKKKIVGLCLGGQLLAEALGGQVQKHPHWEVGWHTVQVIDQSVFKAFQWHGYSFTIPPGAERTATNEACENQSFRFRDHIIGFQFHPESTEQWILECADSPRLPTTGFVQTGEDIKRDLKYQPSLQKWYFSQLEALTQTVG